MEPLLRKDDIAQENVHGMSDIIIKGAREHNLCGVDLRLPRNRLICFTGVSGSGKSSLAFDTLYAEGQRRYIESLSSFARQFLGQLPKPDVDQIAGLSPSISISQKTGGLSPRSTVGTITEIHDFLRVLFARVATPYCPHCGRPISAQTRQQIIDRIETLPEGKRFLMLAPLVRGQKGEHRDLFQSLLKQGFVRARVDGTIVRLAEDLRLDRQMRHDIDVVVDRLVQTGPSGRGRLSEAVERALSLGNGQLIVSTADTAEEAETEKEADKSPIAKNRKKTSKPSASVLPDGDIPFSAHYACTACNVNFEPPTPQMFSFNSPQGMCPKCDGLGNIHSFDPELLIPDGRKSFQQGCVEPIGKWRDIGRWRRHIFAGVAETLERLYELPPHTILETAWEELPEKVRNDLLWGTGDRHITYTWRSGPSGHKWGGKFEGIIPRMLQQYRETKSRMQIAAMNKYMNVIPCGYCHGQRLNAQARSFRLETVPRNPGSRFAEIPQCSLPELSALSITQLREFFMELRLSDSGKTIAAEAVKEIRNRLGFLADVGLDYLSLDRTAPTLSGGEMQRIRLASQIGSGLVGVLYILDEPSIGLHPRDNDRLLETLRHLRDQGNTVVVVEHDEDTMRAADLIVDFGPGPGVRGGEIVACGTPEEVQRNDGKNGASRGGAGRSLTARYLRGEESIEVPKRRREFDPDRQLRVLGATHNNLKNVDVGIPLGTFVCVTGVSGSGKSSLVNDILVEALNRDLNRGLGTPGRFESIEGLDLLDKMISIDQSPIGRTPRSNPATYIKLFDEIRKLYCELPEARAKGYGPGRFSFNVPGGRCEACEGYGAIKLEMDFLADVWVTCAACQGRRFNHETLSVRFKGKSIEQVLSMDIAEALEHFANIPRIKHKLQTFVDVGLGYMKLGQPSPTLSGGEAQRIKLARELVKRSTGKTLYLLDEPTTGLHFADIKLLLKVLHDFVEAGNTVLVVEHNLDVIKTADWIIDLGPEGGEAGGYIVAEGTPEQVTASKNSHTGRVLRRHLEGHARSHQGEKAAVAKDVNESRGASESETEPRALRIRHAEQHNLKSVSVDIPRNRLTVCCGPSGSGKTSLAMDTVYAEGQRRYVESLSSYARQFVGQMQKPRVESIEGLSPAIAIEQKAASHSPRSTVGTVTEIHDYLRVLFARLGTPYCPECDIPVGTQTLDEIIAKVWQNEPDKRLLIAAPMSIEVGQSYEELWTRLKNQGFARVRIDGTVHRLDEPMPEIDRRRKHLVELVVDRVVLSDGGVRARLADSIEIALEFGEGVVHVIEVDPDKPETRWKTQRHSRHLACDNCGRSFEPLSPHHFSFNSPLGWCPHCEGLGVQAGANPSIFLHDPKLTLAEGAVSLWPEVRRGSLFSAMLGALSKETGIPTDVPFEQLDARFRRTILHGTGEHWFEIVHSGLSLRFQYKGIYPAIEEAGRLVSVFRSRFEYFVDEVECGVCLGSRLRDDASAVRFIGRTMDQICRQPLANLLELFEQWEPNETEKKVAGDLLDEVRNRLRFLIEVGLDYLTLSRPAPTLSGGETQRIRLAAQIGSGLVGVLYVLDEPTIGLHPRDNGRLIGALKKLRDLGNTLLLVEHDREVLAEADTLVDFGPKAGVHGGEIVASGTPAEIARSKTSVTGPYLSGKKAIPVPLHRRIGRPAPEAVPRRLEVPTSVSAAGSSLGFPKPPRAPRTERKAAKKAVSAKTASKKTTAKKATPKPAKKTASTKTNVKKAAVEKSAKKPTKKGAKKSASKISATKKTSPEKAAARKTAASQAHKRSPVPEPRFTDPCNLLTVRGARQNNLKSIDVSFPLGALTVVTGVSGSGKSSLVEDVLYKELARTLHRAQTTPGAHDGIEGIGYINKVIRVDQQPLGQTPTSNPATYTGVFELIRDLFAQLPESKIRGYTARRFSFNVPGGRCEKCEGNGQIKIEMHFLPDVWITCDACGGKRYDRQTLEVRYRGRSIADVLEMSCGEALGLFVNIPPIRRILRTLCDVGLDYLALGQAAPTLSGGEAQRVKLASELARPDTGRTLYLLDEPTTGLHFDDLSKLLDVLNRLVDLGNTVVVIEHNLDVIKSADWIIDLGPEAGLEGGHLVFAGTPEELVDIFGTPAGKNSGSRKKPGGTVWRSYTAEALAPVLKAGPFELRRPYDPKALEIPPVEDVFLDNASEDIRMPWESDGPRWHTKDRIGRTGNPCRWDGRILADVVAKIQEADCFAATDWSTRTVVEIRGEKKSLGWFFHAITGEEWLLKMKFRTAKNTFRRDLLVERLDLKPLNEMPDIPLYGTEPRVRVQNSAGPWQEIELKVHSYDEIDRKEFWDFLDLAVAGFSRFFEQKKSNPSELMPWKLLKEKWHFLPKGFLAGAAPEWSFTLLREVFAVLDSVVPQAEILWTNKMSVPYFVGPEWKVDGRTLPWAVVHTKRPEAILLELYVPKNLVPLGSILGISEHEEVDGSHPDYDVVQLRFAKKSRFKKHEIRQFLASLAADIP